MFFFYWLIVCYGYLFKFFVYFVVSYYFLKSICRSVCLFVVGLLLLLPSSLFTCEVPNLHSPTKLLLVRATTTTTQNIIINFKFVVFSSLLPLSLSVFFARFFLVLCLYLAHVLYHLYEWYISVINVLYIYYVHIYH